MPNPNSDISAKLERFTSPHITLKENNTGQWRTTNESDRDTLNRIGLCEEWFRTDELDSILEAVSANGYWLETISCEGPW